MGYSLDLVSTIKRIDWIKNKFKLEEVIYMGDGIFDHYVMKAVRYSIAPSNADFIAKKYAKYITKRSGGDRAVAEACLHILEKFLNHIILICCLLQILSNLENGQFNHQKLFFKIQIFY